MAARLGRRGAAQRLPRNETERRPFAIDLRSERVRLAQSLLDGVREGQALSASCSATASSARCTSAGSTASCPASGAISRLPELSRAQERLAFVTAMGGINPFQFIMEAEAAIAARLVVDAGAARRAGHGDGRGPRAGAWSRASSTGSCWRGCSAPGRCRSPSSARPRRRARAPALLTEELRALDAAVDALGDALTAEGVYQAVRGNPARAAASVDALAHGEIQPPELEVVADAARGRGGHAPAADAVLRHAGPGAADRRARRAGGRRAGARAVAAPDARRPAPGALRGRVRRRHRQGAAAARQAGASGALVAVAVGRALHVARPT